MATTMRTARKINVAALAVHPASTGRSTREPVVVDVDELLDRPRDLDDLVGMLRFSIAWHLDVEPIGTLAAMARVDVDRLAAFMRASARQAGELLTLAEVARLARVLGERLVDRSTEGELEDMRKIAECYMQVAANELGTVAGCYRRALRTARAARRRSMAQHWGAAGCPDD